MDESLQFVKLSISALEQSFLVALLAEEQLGTAAVIEEASSGPEVEMK